MANARSPYRIAGVRCSSWEVVMPRTLSLQSGDMVAGDALGLVVQQEESCESQYQFTYVFRSRKTLPRRYRTLCERLSRLSEKRYCGPSALYIRCLRNRPRVVRTLLSPSNGSSEPVVFASSAFSIVHSCRFALQPSDLLFFVLEVVLTSATTIRKKNIYIHCEKHGSQGKKGIAFPELFYAAIAAKMLQGCSEIQGCSRRVVRNAG